MGNNASWREWVVSGSQLGRGAFAKIDFHVHTDWTDGCSTVQELIAAGVDAGLQAMAFTEHVNLTSEWYPDFHACLCTACDEAHAVKLYHGVEVAAMSPRGALKAADDVLERAPLVVGVVHSYPKGENEFYRMAELSAAQALELEHQTLLALAKNPRVDILGHPGATYTRHFGAFPLERLEDVCRTAKAHGVAVELNARHCPNLREVVALLVAVDPLVTLGSDVHHTSDVGLILRRLAALDEGRTRS